MNKRYIPHILASLTTLSAMGQEIVSKREPADTRSVRFPVQASITPEINGYFTSDLDGGDADIYSFRTGVNFTAPIQVGEVPILLTGNGFYHRYEFSGFETLLPGVSDPIDEAFSTTIAPLVFLPVAEDWMIFGGLGIDISAESGADIGDSITYGGLGGVRWQALDNLAILGGVLVDTQLEDDVQIIPILGIEWQITNNLKFDALGTRGLTTELSYKMTDNWTVFGLFEYQTDDFRLDDNGPIPGGVFRHDRVPFAVGLEWNPSDQVQMRIFGGASLWQEITFDNAAGTELFDDESDIAPYAGVSLTIRF